MSTALIMHAHTHLADMLCYLFITQIPRPINKVQGFSRETTTALLANIESAEWIRRERVNLQMQPEHPRASTTDDVECFFSVTRDLVGKSFTLKRVVDEWKKIGIEFDKRQQKDLFYYSSSHDRFYEGERPSFNEKPLQPAKPMKVPQRETHYTNSITVGRISLPVRGSVSKRVQFHKGPVALPRPPALETHDYL